MELLSSREDFLLRVFVHVFDGLADFAGVPNREAKVADFRQAFLAERSVVLEGLSYGSV